MIKEHLVKRIKELERIYGIQHGGDHGNQYTEAKPNNSDLPKSQSDLATQMGISVDTLQNYKQLAEMIGISVLDILSSPETVITLYGKTITGYRH